MKHNNKTFGHLQGTTLVPILALLGWMGLHSQTGAQPVPWEDPAYDTNIRAPMAESRPGPDETGWTAWLRHHENRKRWCAEKDADLLMVGDSSPRGDTADVKAVCAMMQSKGSSAPMRTTRRSIGSISATSSAMGKAR